MRQGDEEYRVCSGATEAPRGYGGWEAVVNMALSYPVGEASSWVPSVSS